MHVALTVQLDSPKNLETLTKCSRPVNVTSYVVPPGEIPSETCTMHIVMNYMATNLAIMKAEAILAILMQPNREWSDSTVLNNYS